MPYVLFVGSYVGYDHRIITLQKIFYLFGLFLISNVDGLFSIFGCPYSYYFNTVDSKMSVLKLGMENLSLMMDLVGTLQWLHDEILDNKTFISAVCTAVGEYDTDLPTVIEILRRRENSSMVDESDSSGNNGEDNVADKMKL